MGSAAVKVKWENISVDPLKLVELSPVSAMWRAVRWRVAPNAQGLL